MMRHEPAGPSGATGIALAKDTAPPEPKRLNRTVGVGDAISGVLDAALRKRGFATRDIITRWGQLAPTPYDRVAQPAELKWPRGAGHEGATLVLRCADSHRLALAHDGPQVAAAVNRYFGYFLVREVRLSAEPFKPPEAAERPSAPVSRDVDERVTGAVAAVTDPSLRDALRELGLALASRRKR
jgi:hypothetical protein